MYAFASTRRYSVQHQRFDFKRFYSNQIKTEFNFKILFCLYFVIGTINKILFIRISGQMTVERKVRLNIFCSNSV